MTEKIKLTKHQYEYIQALEKGFTVEQLVSFMLKKKMHVHFRELYSLIETLVKNSVITNHDFRKFFHSEDDVDLRVAPTESGIMIKNWSEEKILELPFFRTLPKEIGAQFVDCCELVEYPARTKILSHGDATREMYVLLEGEVAVYKIEDKNKRKLITMVPAGSIFGEGGFMLAKPRSADVITTIPSVVGKITYNDKIFTPLFRSSPPEDLQKRFWVLHGLLSSPLFHNVPAETMDRFMFTGKAKLVQQGQFICEEGKEGVSFFVVIQGEVAITKTERLLRVLKQGDIFGEVALMVSGGMRTATAQALSDVLLLEVNQDEFFTVLSQNLMLASELESVAQKRYDGMYR